MFGGHRDGGEVEIGSWFLVKTQNSGVLGVEGLGDVSLSQTTVGIWEGLIKSSHCSKFIFFFFFVLYLMGCTQKCSGLTSS